MKKILILGAGKGQVPFVHLCKQKGYQTIVVSIQGDYPAFALADKSYFIDICDKEGVLEIARKEKVDAILNQLDVGVPTVAYVSEKLGLPSIGVETAKKFANKYLMLECAEKIGISIPKYFIANTLEEALTFSKRLQYPLVIKPTDNTASKGVFKIEKEDDLLKKFGNSIVYSKDKQVILEEYIEGKEYVVDSLTCDYTCTSLIIGKSKYFQLRDIFIPQSRIFHSTTNIQEAIEQRVLEVNRVLIESMQLKYGITHAEYIYNEKENKIYLIEIAARGGGVNIASDIIPLVSGVDAYEIQLDYLLGIDMSYPIKRAEKFVGYFCFLLPNGVIKKISGLECIFELKNVRKVCLENIYVDKEIELYQNKASRFGPILISGNTEDECRETWEEIKNLLDIQVETNEGKKGIIWE